MGSRSQQKPMMTRYLRRARGATWFGQEAGSNERGSFMPYSVDFDIRVENENMTAPRHS